MPSIVFLDASTLSHGDLDLGVLNHLGHVILYPTSNKNEIIKRIKTAEIVVTNKAILDTEALSHALRLNFISICATGTNVVDLNAAKEKGIRVANVTDYSTSAVAQHTMTFILNWATQIHRYIQEPKLWAKSTTFTRLDYPVIELAGHSLGLLGTGKIGCEVGRLAEAFGMIVRGWARKSSPHPRKKDPWPRLPLRQLLANSDIVSLHCPLTEETHHVINRQSLRWMKKGAFLVNTGRGGLVDEMALKEALLAGHLGGAGLDVLSIEPPPPNHPLINLQHSNLMITPHSAWTTHEARKRLLQETVINIEAFLKGKTRNCIV